MNILKRTLAGLLVVFLAFGQVTSIPGIVDAILGASNITTAGACVYVSASGTLNQDSPGCHWDDTNNRLGLGTATPSERLTIFRNEANPVSIRIGNTVGAGLLTMDSSGHINLRAETAGKDIRFQGNSVTAGVMTNAGSWGIGPSNTSPTGTLHVKNAAAGGATTVTIQAGDTQGSTGLQQWLASGGTVGATMYDSGDFEILRGFTSRYSGNSGIGLRVFNGSSVQFFNVGYLDNSRVGLGSAATIGWTSGTSAYAAADLGLSRSSANNLGITNGSSTTYATVGADGIILNNGRFQIPTSTPASASTTCTAGTITWDTNFTYVCVATDTWKRAAMLTW